MKTAKNTCVSRVQSWSPFMTWLATFKMKFIAFLNSLLYHQKLVSRGVSYRNEKTVAMSIGLIHIVCISRLISHIASKTDFFMWYEYKAFDMFSLPRFPLLHLFTLSWPGNHSSWWYVFQWNRIQINLWVPKRNDWISRWHYLIHLDLVATTHQSYLLLTSRSLGQCWCIWQIQKVCRFMLVCIEEVRKLKKGVYFEEHMFHLFQEYGEGSLIPESLWTLLEETCVSNGGATAM